MAAVDAEHPVIAVAFSLVEQREVETGGGVEVGGWWERDWESHGACLCEEVLGGHLVV